MDLGLVPHAVLNVQICVSDLNLHRKRPVIKIRASDLGQDLGRGGLISLSDWSILRLKAEEGTRMHLGPSRAS